ncbi:hypothetical protein AVEN_175399-1 [Araneus ventricosus]|uniref:STPR domain-containing protein n=1 Tax=Araneus ventricosus TaxID=182803 RepID=A0A4Y1ZX62_ARAVE|nr:hypothetical protein AVEN_175399-1 [Araneus ventricosus]
MLPIDSRQLENVKGELLKLTKKETMEQRSLDRRAEEAEEQNNNRLPVMAQRGQQRRAEETEEKDIADFQPWRECWVCDSLPHFFSPPGNDALFDIARVTPGHVLMAQRGQKRREEESEEQRNRGLSDMAQRGQKRKAEQTEEQRNSRLSDTAQCSQERRAEKNRRTKEWPIGQTGRVT